MELKLIRKDFAKDYTIGDLLVDGKFECYVLEDVVRDEKIHGKTAIPYGKYSVIINQSNRFKRLLPLLVNVPNYEGVRIHTGNTALDTEGCLLPGRMKQKGRVLQSKLAFDALFAKMQQAVAKGEKITIEIVKGNEINYV
jgi:hypothetical protein